MAVFSNMNFAGHPIIIDNQLQGTGTASIKKCAPMLRVWYAGARHFSRSTLRTLLNTVRNITLSQGAAISLACMFFVLVGLQNRLLQRLSDLLPLWRLTRVYFVGLASQV